MTESQAQGIVNSLVRAGFLHVVGNSGKESYVPTQDYAGIRLREILDSIEDENRRVPSSPDDFAKNYVAGLVAGVKQRRASQTDELTFERLVADIEEGEALSRKMDLGI
jgi:hypothetical protein